MVLFERNNCSNLNKSNFVFLTVNIGFLRYNMLCIFLLGEKVIILLIFPNKTKVSVPRGIIVNDLLFKHYYIS